MSHYETDPQLAELDELLYRCEERNLDEVLDGPLAEEVTAALTLLGVKVCLPNKPGPRLRQATGSVLIEALFEGQELRLRQLGVTFQDEDDPEVQQPWLTGLLEEVG
jgi:hypothetical protein